MAAPHTRPSVASCGARVKPPSQPPRRADNFGHRGGVNRTPFLPQTAPVLPSFSPAWGGACLTARPWIVLSWEGQVEGKMIRGKMIAGNLVRTLIVLRLIILPTIILPSYSSCRREHEGSLHALAPQFA